MYDGLRLGEQLDRWLGLDQLLCLLLSELLGDEGGVGVGRWYGIGRFLALKSITVNIVIIATFVNIQINILFLNKLILYKKMLIYN